MVEDLTFVVLFVLDWVKWEIELCEQFKLLDVLELEHFWDLVEGNIEEAECLDILETNEVPDSVLGNVELAEAGQVAEATDPRDWIVGKAELLEVQAVQVLNFRDIVLPKWEGDEALIAHNALNLVNLIAIKAQNFQVRIKADVLNHSDLIVRIVDFFKVCRRLEVKHFPQTVIARV